MKINNWLDYETLDVIRDSMLTYKDYDADMIYRGMELCKFDPVMVNMYKSWMKESEPSEKDFKYMDIVYRIILMEDYFY